MKLGNLFRRRRLRSKEKAKLDNSRNDSIVEDKPPPYHGSAEIVDRSGFLSRIGTPHSPHASKASTFLECAGGTEEYYSHSKPFEENVSSEFSNNSENEDTVSDMPPNPGARNKGVRDSFQGLRISHRLNVPKIEKDADVIRELSEAYDAVPEMEQTKLPRGGISVETAAVGRIQVSISASCFI